MGKGETMAKINGKSDDEVIEELVNYSDINPRARYIVTFAADDSYECDEVIWDEDDNGEEFDVGEDGYEDWPAAMFHIVRIIKDAPNPARYKDWINLSRLHMPSEVTSGGRLLYSAEKGLFLDHGEPTETPRTDI